MLGIFSKTKEMLAPVSGQVVPLRNVPNQIVAAHLLGKGVAILPTDTKIYAPIGGIVTVKSKFEHSYAINSADNMEVFVHIGINTMLLKGNGFTSHIKKGSIVKAGDLIATIDLNTIKASGHYPHILLLMTRPPMNGAYSITDRDWVRGGQSTVIRLN